MVTEKLSKDTLKKLELSFMAGGKLDYFESIKHLNLNQLRQSGEFMYLLIKFGYSPIDIDQILNIRVKTIERRILNGLKIMDKTKDTYDYYVFLFENVNGFPLIDMYRLYMRSNLCEESFIAREGIDKDSFKKIKEMFSTSGVSKYEDEVRQKMKDLHKKEDESNYVRRRRKGRFPQIIKIA